MNDAEGNQLDLGSLLDEVKDHCDDSTVLALLEELIDFEKSYPYSYKSEIQNMLVRHAEGAK